MKTFVCAECIHYASAVMLSAPGFNIEMRYR